MMREKEEKNGDERGGIQIKFLEKHKFDEIQKINTPSE